MSPFALTICDAVKMHKPKLSFQCVLLPLKSKHGRRNKEYWRDPGDAGRAVGKKKKPSTWSTLPPCGSGEKARTTCCSARAQHYFSQTPSNDQFVWKKRKGWKCLCIFGTVIVDHVVQIIKIEYKLSCKSQNNVNTKKNAFKNKLDI